MTKHTATTTTTTGGDQINPRAMIGDNRRAASEASNGIEKIEPARIDLWRPAKDQAEDHPEDVIDETIAAIKSGQQRSAVPVRSLGDGRFEAVAKGHIVRAAQSHNATNPETPVEIDIRVVRDVSDEAAFRLLAMDVEQDHQPSSLARGRFFVQAIETFGSVKATAESCRVSEAKVSKNLDVVRCLDHIGDKVDDPRAINQRDACWLMQSVARSESGNATSNPVRDRILHAIEQADRQPAAALFKRIREAARVGEVPVPKNRRLLADGDTEFGYVKISKGEPTRIDFTNIIDLDPQQIGRAIAKVIAKLRDERN